MADSSNNAAKPPPRLYLFTHPRTCSNLLEKLLGGQPNVEQSGSRFLELFMMTSKKLNDADFATLPQQEQDKWRQMYQVAFDKMQDFVAVSETNGARILMKEHTLMLTDPATRYRLGNYKTRPSPSSSTTSASSTFTVLLRGDSAPRPSTNLTLFPDNFLRSWLPVILIRHPARSFPSMARAMRDTVGVGLNHAAVRYSATYIWLRELHDWYSQQEQHGEKTQEGPKGDSIIVLDADDLLRDPPAVMKDLCARTALDFDAIRFTWDAASAEKLEQLGPNKSRMLSTMNASTGIVKSNAAGEELNLRDEVEKWKGEFGPDGAETLLGYVEAAMGDYEYLRARRICAQS